MEIADWPEMFCRKGVYPEEQIRAYHWPGNVRQLELALSAAAALCEGDEITPANLLGWLHKAMAPTGITEEHFTDVQTQGHEQKDAVRPEERARYLSALNANRYRGTGRWNISRAARELGIPRETLAYRLKKIGISNG